MEPVLSPQADHPPWTVDGTEGSGYSYRLCKDYVLAQLGITMRDTLLMTQDEWSSYLRDAYRELVTLGILTP